MTYSEQLRFISRVRLPLIIAVVFIHVQTPSIPHSADWWFIKILGWKYVHSRFHDLFP